MVEKHGCAVCGMSCSVVKQILRIGFKVNIENHVTLHFVTDNLFRFQVWFMPKN